MNQVLQLDITGLPRRWLSVEDTVALYCKDKVRWELGSDRIVVRGGVNSRGERSLMNLAPVVAIEGTRKRKRVGAPILANPLLFRRDNNLCMYCGFQFTSRELTRDHVIPRVQGGQDRWTNVVSACQRCNHSKGGRTPEQAGMKLLAVPFEPNVFEFMYLANRRILADQMEYLSARFSGQREWAVT
ncbi:HNH endonuclease [Aurantivibrio plasticivorans]